MKYCICYYTFIPLRSEPSEKSEMVSQILFGELVEIQEEKNYKDFCSKKHIDFTGWCNSKSLYPISIEEKNHLNPDRIYITSEIVSVIKSVSNNEKIYLGAGSTLSFIDNNIIKVFDKLFFVEDSLIVKSDEPKREIIIKSAEKFLTVPYLWGGRSSFGTDCSGFVQNIFKQAGIALPRDARQQFLKGDPIDSVENALPGDLMFFQNENKDITHTGIYTGENQIIHASGCVKINYVDNEGIMICENEMYTHKLAGIKRILQ